MENHQKKKNDAEIVCARREDIDHWRGFLKLSANLFRTRK